MTPMLCKQGKCDLITASLTPELSVIVINALMHCKDPKCMHATSSHCTDAVTLLTLGVGSAVPTQVHIRATLYRQLATDACISYDVILHVL